MPRAGALVQFLQANNERIEQSNPTRLAESRDNRPHVYQGPSFQESLTERKRLAAMVLPRGEEDLA
ncbi:MAG: hypothetical protein J0H31_04650 [Alphaproteobacteria bacterium]|nr:hypothetical protein [Alphaproteobacteria bacterium]